MHELLAALNDKQRAAVEAVDGPVLILAGAGSGKTKTLIHRIAYLIAKHNVKPYNILSVTFTNKAAGEMRERLHKLLDGKVKQFPIMGTFHSVCVQLLRREIQALNYNQQFVIYNDDDTSSLVKKIMKDLGFDTKVIAPAGIKSLISKAKNNLLTPEQYAEEASEVIERTASQVYTQYQKELHTNNALDFDDLIRLPVQLFQTYPETLKKYQEAFKYILVDEYQDTNHAQYTLVNMLAKEHKNICVVGDDWQCVTPDTKIQLTDGSKKAKDIKVGDQVLAAAGRTTTMAAPVRRIHKSTVHTELIEITTKTGHRLCITPKHMMFARLSDRAHYFYTYLMYRHDLGYRIGMAKSQRSTNGHDQMGLGVRGNQERADKMWILKVSESKQAAQYWELYYAFYYGIPSVVFSTQNLSSIGTKEIHSLYRAIDTKSRVQKLCADLNLQLDFPHYRPSGTTRFQTERKVLRLDWFAETRKTQASPWYASRIALHTTNKKLKTLLQKNGYHIRKSKKDTWRLEMSQLDIKKAEIVSQQLHDLLPEVEFVRSAWMTSNKKMLLLPAAHLHKTMVIPILDQKHRIIEDEIVSIRKVPYHGTVLDFDIDTVHNYSANGIVVHNSIYSWRGANLQNILDFETDYPNATVVKLEQNYRSTKSILAAANEIIKYNVKQKEKSLWTENARGHNITIKEVGDEKEEGEYIIREIFMPGDSRSDNSRVVTTNDTAEIEYVSEDEPVQPTSLLDRIMSSQTFQTYQVDNRLQDRIKQQSRLIDLKKYVILYRTNAQSRALEEAFLKYNVPYRIIGGIKFYERREIKDLIAYMRVVANPADWVSLDRIVNVPARSLGANSWKKIEQACRAVNKNFLEVLPEELPTLRPQQQEAFLTFQKLMVGIHGKIATLSPSDSLDLITKLSHYKDQFNPRLPEDMSRLENIDELKSVTKKFDSMVGADGIMAFLEDVTLVSDQDDIDERSNAVNMMTIHAAKGLEFDTVFITGMEEGLFPHSRSLFQPTEMEEERRLCYVALTRAKRKAYFIYAAQRTVYGTTQIHAPSRFLHDIPKDLVDRS